MRFKSTYNNISSYLIFNDRKITMRRTAQLELKTQPSIQITASDFKRFS